MRAEGGRSWPRGPREVERTHSAEAPGAPDAPSPIRGITRNVFVLSLVSLCTDVSSEMIYPLVPLLLTGALGVPATVVGMIEGLAEAIANVLKLVSGRIIDRRGGRRGWVFAGYGLSPSRSRSWRWRPSGRSSCWRASSTG